MGIVRTFDIDRPFVARQAFEFAGRVYAPGDLFPWREVGTERDVRTLWRAMRVANGDPVAAPVPPAPGVAQVVTAALARAEQGNPPSPAVDLLPPGFAVPPTPTDADGVARIRAVPDERVTVPAPDPKPGKRPRAGA